MCDLQNGYTTDLVDGQFDVPRANDETTGHAPGPGPAVEGVVEWGRGRGSASGASQVFSAQPLTAQSQRSQGLKCQDVRL